MKDLIRQKVCRLVHFYKSNDPFEIVRGMNVIVVYYPLEGVRGFYQYFQRNNIIYIDERLPDHEKRFVLAHELGHMLLHKKSNAIFMDTRTHFNGDRFEQEADLFAMTLLLSDQFLYVHHDYTVEQLARFTGYHQELIRLRLQHLKTTNFIKNT